MEKEETNNQTQELPFWINKVLELREEVKKEMKKDESYKNKKK